MGLEPPPLPDICMTADDVISTFNMLVTWNLAKDVISYFQGMQKEVADALKY